MEKIEIHEDNKGVSFFSLRADDKEVGRMLVNVTSDILEAGYTSVDLTQRKNGYGRKLVNAVVDYARENNLKIIAKCGFVAMMFKKHPELYEEIQGRR